MDEQTSDKHIAVAPFEVPQNGIECMRRIGDEDDLVGLCADQLGECLPVSYEVVWSTSTIGGKECPWKLTEIRRGKACR